MSLNSSVVSVCLDHFKLEQSGRWGHAIIAVLVACEKHGKVSAQNVGVPSHEHIYPVTKTILWSSWDSGKIGLLKDAVTDQVCWCPAISLE